MADVQAMRITQISQWTAPNLLPLFLTFNKFTGYTAWDNVTPGSGVSSNEGSLFFYGNRSLYMSATNPAVNYEINSGGDQTRFTASQTGRYVFSFWLYNYPTGSTAGDMFYVKLAKNGAANWTRIVVDAEQMDGAANKWIGFWAELSLTQNDYLDFSFGIPINDSGTERVLRTDGLAMNFDDRYLAYPAEYSEPDYNLPPAVDLADGKYVIESNEGFTEFTPETP